MSLETQTATTYMFQTMRMTTHVLRLVETQVVEMLVKTIHGIWKLPALKKSLASALTELPGLRAESVLRQRFRC